MIDAHARAKKGTGLDGLFKGYEPQQLEEERKVIVTGSGTSALKKVWKKYDRWTGLSGGIDFKQRERFVQNPNYRLKGMKVNEVLTPVEINSFVQSKLADDAHSSSLFLSKLVQNSYLAGFNDFEIHTTNLVTDMAFPSYLKSARQDPLRIIIRGNMEQLCAKVSGIEITLYGTAAHIGPEVTSSYVTVYGDLHDGGCFNGRYSTFTFHGKLLKAPHHAFTYNEIGSHAGGCIFRTSDAETLEKLRVRVPCGVSERQKGGHKIVFIKPDGLEETVRNFHYDT